MKTQPADTRACLQTALNSFRGGLTRHRGIVVVVLTVLLVTALAAMAVGPAAATQQGDTQSPTVDSASGPDSQLAYSGNATWPPAAEDSVDYGLIPTDNELEMGEDSTVDVHVTAQDLGESDPIHKLEFELEYDESEIELEDVSPTDGVIATTAQEDDALEISETSEPGSDMITVDVEWDGPDVGGEDILEQISGEGDDIEFPAFADDDLFRFTFSPGENAEEGGHTTVAIGDREATGAEDVGIIDNILGTDLFSYDPDNIWAGEGTIEYVPESLDPAIDEAVGSFTATSSPEGYISFGEDGDPGKEDAVAELPPIPDFDDYADDEIIIEADFTEDGEWRALPDDISFPDVPATDDDVPTNVNVLEPMEGYLDFDEETMNITSSTLEVENTALAGQAAFKFDLKDSTSEGSGDLSDGAAAFDVDTDTWEGDGETSLVDNEFIVDEERQEEAGYDYENIEENAQLVDDDGNWVADEEGANFLELNLDMQFEEFVGEDSELEGVVEDNTGDEIENASVDIIDDATADVITDEDGSFSVDGFEPGEQEVRVNAEGYEPFEQEIDFEPLETTEQDFMLAPGETEYNVNATPADDEVVEEDVVGVRVQVENEGTGSEEQEITLTADGEQVDSKTIELGEDIDDAVTPDLLDHETDFTLEWEAEGEGDVDLEVESDDDTDAATVEVIDETDLDIDAMLEGESEPGGYIGFEDDSASEAEEEGLMLPPDGDEVEEAAGEPITIEGLVSGDSWTSTDVDFPTLFVEDADLEAEVSAPLGLDGTYDHEADEMTIEGLLQVAVEGAGSFEFEIEAVTDSSGALTGEADLDEEGGAVVAVDNEFIADDETGDGVIDSAVGLPATDSGSQWLYLPFEFDAEEVDGDLALGDIEGEVTDDSGDPIEGATVEVGDSDTRTDEDGAYVLENVEAGEYDATVEAEGHEEAETEVEIEDGETVTENFELASGEAEFTVDLAGDSAPAGDTVEVEATVENVGEAEGSTDATIELEDEEETTELDVGGGDSETFSLTWETAEDDEGTFTAELTAGDESDTAEVEVDEPLDDAGADATFTATSTDGYILFTEDEFDEDEALDLPTEDGGNPIEIEGLIEDGEWESTSVDFPDIEDENLPLPASVDTPGLEGELDVETGEMTADGTLEVDLDGEASFEFDIGLTTGESGELTGEATTDAVLTVDNKYTVDEQSGNGAVDGSLDLPADDPGENWLELELSLDVTELDGDGLPTGTVEGIIKDDEGEAIEGATVESSEEEGTTNSDGEYEVEVYADGDDLDIAASGHLDKTAEVDVAEDETEEEDFELETATAEFETELGSEEGLVYAVVENVGDAEGETSVSLEAEDEFVEETITLEPDESETIELDVPEDDTVEASAEAGGEETAASLATDEDADADSDDSPDGDADVFAESTGGFMFTDDDTIGDLDEDEIEELLFEDEDGLAFPPVDHENTEDWPTGESPIQIVGEVDEDDGTWQATDVEFPDLYVPSADLIADVEAPDLGGEYDPESGVMTVAGQMDVDVIDSDAELEFEIDATTEDSGALTGEMDVDDEGGSAVFVDNEYVITEESGSPIIDAALGIDEDGSADTEGQNWLQLEMELDLEPEDAETEETESASESDDDEQEAGTFLTAFGQLVGFVGLLAGVVVMGLGIASRVIGAVDPDV